RVGSVTVGNGGVAVDVRKLAIGLALALVVGACGGDGASTSAPSSTTATTSESATTVAPDPAADLDPRVAELLDFPDPDPIDLEFVLAEDLGVSERIGPDGGVLEATGPDGTEYRLEIPAGALVSDTIIAMIPLTEVSGVPVDGPVAGVHLAPEGLVLYELATLTVVPPGDASNMLMGGSLDGGRDFYLALSDVVDGAVVAEIAHFSIYTNMTGRDQIADIRARYEPTTAQARFQDRISLLNETVPDDVEFLTLLLVYMKEWLHQSVIPRLQSADDATLDQALGEAIEWHMRALEFELSLAEDYDQDADTAFGILNEDYPQLYTQMSVSLTGAINRAYVRCQGADVDAAAQMLRWGQLALALKLDELADFDRAGFLDKVGDCVQFELEVTSSLEEEGVFASVVIQPVLLKPQPSDTIASLKMLAEGVTLEYITFELPGGQPPGCDYLMENGVADIELHLEANINYANPRFTAVILRMRLTAAPEDGIDCPQVQSNMSFWVSQFRRETGTIGGGAQFFTPIPVVRSGDVFARLDNEEVRITLTFRPGF
ncbi:MAG: hypothetical protein R3246_12280, partial [Acidimicrobiia bacterium]|nr:hypothetical protein [Acidimicrobiia bacterium]